MLLRLAIKSCDSFRTRHSDKDHSKNCYGRKYNTHHSTAVGEIISHIGTEEVVSVGAVAYRNVTSFILRVDELSGKNRVAKSANSNTSNSDSSRHSFSLWEISPSSDNWSHKGQPIS